MDFCLGATFNFRFKYKEVWSHSRIHGLLKTTFVNSEPRPGPDVGVHPTSMTHASNKE